MVFLSMGKETYKVPLQLFQDNRQKLVKELVESKAPAGSVIFLRSGPSPSRYDTDHEPVFRQESYFWWLMGVKEPDCAFMLSIATGEVTLFVPNLPADYATVMGPLRTNEEWKELYQVDHVLYTEDIEVSLEKAIAGSDDAKVLLMKGPNTDSGSMFEPPTLESASLQRAADTTTLFPILAECRVIKSPMELDLLQQTAQITSFAHAYVMRNMKPGMMEYQGESLFKHYSYYNYGSRLVSYTSICGCGPNAAILHYGHAGEPNSRQLGENDMCLFDMGAEYMCYASDITCSFPASGKFSERDKPIYTAVLNAQVAVYDLLKPGASYLECHKAAEAELLKVLQKIGIVKVPAGVTIDELVEQRLGAVFMPHGLGHFIGIDTHDVGGYLPGHPERIMQPGLQKLRTARVMKEHMVLTVEPGCYFIDHLLDGALAGPLGQYLDGDLLQAYRGYGGVRLEDMVVITDDGCINYTLCPRTMDEVEHVVGGGKWPPLKDEAPELRRLKLCEPIPMGPPPSQ